MMNASGVIRHAIPSSLVRRVRPVLGPPYRAARDLAERVVAPYHRYRYHWPHPVLSVIGPQRSGTQLLVGLLAGVPGYRWRWPNDPDHCVENHDVCDHIFASLPRNRYTVLKLHTTAKPWNLEILKKYNRRAIIMYRDLRDECVSRYFLILHDPRHRHHRYYNEVSKEVGMSHCVEFTMHECIPWVQEWRSIVARHPDRFYEVRFEEFRPDPRAAFSRVLSFLGIGLSAEAISRIAARVAATTRFDLKANLRDGMLTIRKGTVGDWRNHFTSAHIQRFKEGCGKFLIELGYEQDLHWTRERQLVGSPQ